MRLLILSLMLFAGCRTTGSRLYELPESGTPLVQICGTKTNPGSVQIVYSDNFVSVGFFNDDIVKDFFVYGADGFVKYQTWQSGSPKVFSMAMIKPFIDRVRELRQFLIANRHLNPIASDWIERSVLPLPAGKAATKSIAKASISFFQKKDASRVDSLFSVNFPNDISPRSPLFVALDGSKIVSMPLPVSFEFHSYFEGKFEKMKTENFWWGGEIFPRESSYFHDGEKRGMYCTEPSNGTAADIPQITGVPQESSSVSPSESNALSMDIFFSLSLIANNPNPQESDYEASAFLMCSQYVQLTAKAEPTDVSSVAASLGARLNRHSEFKIWRAQVERDLKNRFGAESGPLYERILWNGCVAGQWPELRRK